MTGGSVLRAHLNLLRAQVAHDLRLRYVGSVAGLYWSILNPLIQLAVYLLLVTVIFKTRHADARLAYAAFLLAGLSPWLAFHEGLVNGAASIVRHGAVVKNVVFPKELLPLSAVLCTLVSYALSLAGAAVVAVAAGHGPGLAWLLLPPLALLQVAFTCGFAYGLAVVNTFLRDVAQILPVVLQALLFATPVLYERGEAPELIRGVLWFNPLYLLVDMHRGVLLRHETPELGAVAYLLLWTAVVLPCGLGLFRRTKGYFEAVL